MTVTVPVPRFVEALGQWQLRAGPRYLALAGATRRAITDGRLPAGARIPSERAIADALGVSRTTVTASYNALHEGGYLQRRRGAGSTVRLPDAAARGSWFALDDTGADIDLSLAALPAPAAQLADAFERAGSRAPALLGGHGYLLHGLPELRELLAARYRARGLETDADQILVTAGAQQALAMLFELLVRPLQPVLVEAASYPGALMLLRHQRARTAAIPLGAEGWDVDAFAHAAGTLRPGLAYLIPDYHNPTGLVMGEGQRLALAEAAAASGVPLVVDETFVDLRLHGPPPPRPLAAYDPSGETLTVGSLSKSLWGGLRIGWIRAQPHMIRRLAELRMRHDLSSPLLEQLVSAELLRDDAAMAAQRDRAREQRDALAAALRSQLPDVRFALAAGGLSLWLELPAPDSSDLAAAARRHEMIITPGPTFSPDGALERYLRLPFVLPGEVLAEAVGRLALCRGEAAAWQPQRDALVL
jgi:DNA-binding transcriptional MocR family regulator